jgi:hypothetical protein
MNDLHDFVSQVCKNSLKKKGQLAVAPKNSDHRAKFDKCEDFLQACFLFVCCIAVSYRCEKEQN